MPTATALFARLVRLALPLFSAVAGLSILGCGGASAFDGRSYSGHGMELTLGPQASSWSRLETSSGLLAFRDDANRATILMNGRCGVDGEDVPLVSLTNHLFLQFTERTIESEDTVQFDGREARKTTLSAKLDGVPMRFEAWVMKKNGCVYDFILLSEPSTFDNAKAPFERFVGGFHAAKP